MMNNFNITMMTDFDIVITWVDWSNKNFINKMIEAGGRSEGCESGEFIEMKYLLRSLEKHKVNYRNIHIVYSPDHPPPPYLKETDRLFFVPHSKIVSDKSHLPLIHRESIIAHLHNIPNLYKYYYYFQDDLFIMNNIIFDIQIEKFNNKEIHVYKKKLDDKYDVTKSCGLWYQSTVNSANAIRGVNKGEIIIFEHSVQLFDKDIMNEIESKYPKHFLYTKTYKNQQTEKYKEPFLICATSMFCNYLIYKKGFKELLYDELKIYQIHTDENTNNLVLINNLNSSLDYWILNAQGDGISDEYSKSSKSPKSPKSDELHNIFYSFLEKTFPNKTVYENENYKKENFVDNNNINYVNNQNNINNIKNILYNAKFIILFVILFIMIYYYFMIYRAVKL